MVWFTRIIIMFTMIGVTSGVCTTCDRCVNNTCLDPSKSWCFCVDGCKQGYFGQWCNYDCPDQCLTCGRHYEKEGTKTQGMGICYECNDGYHNGSSTNCLCPINCPQCTSTTQCTLCNQGWYGTMCELPCPTNCKNQICGKENGNCFTGCNDGWFSTKCDQECPNAFSCKDNKCNQTDGVCYECSPGKHGYNCDTDCRSINCLDNECNRTNGVCTKGCSGNFAPGNDYLCQTCIAGKYGDMCDDDCLSKNCKNNTCDKNTGTCIDECIDNHDLGSNKLCQVCIAGKYGDICDNDCLSKNCKNNTCDKNTGTCINECIDNYVLGSDKLCETCIAGKYGRDCNTNCPSIHCLNNTCNQDNGVCTHGCRSSSFIGYYCDKCKIGLYGSNCDLFCPSNCKDNVCTRSEDNCEHGCISDNLEGTKCDTCIAGFYGGQCNLKCPLNCELNICDQRTGDCSQGCIGNSAGSRCDVCIDGVYGIGCSTRCPSAHCFMSRCNISTGVCESCMDGYYGSFCDMKCYRSCFNNTCDQFTGECSNGSHGNSEEMKDGAHDTSTNISCIAGCIFGGFSLTLNVLLVIYLCYTRRQIAATETRHGAGRDDTQVIYENDGAEIVSVEPKQVNTYEDLNRRTDDDTSIYNVPQ